MIFRLSHTGQNMLHPPSLPLVRKNLKNYKHTPPPLTRKKQDAYIVLPRKVGRNIEQDWLEQKTCHASSSGKEKVTIRRTDSHDQARTSRGSQKEENEENEEKRGKTRKNEENRGKMKKTKK